MYARYSNTLYRVTYISTFWCNCDNPWVIGRQCPMSGNLHYYGSNLHSRCRSCVSMPYGGQHTPLRKCMCQSRVGLSSVSMPYTGRHTFLLVYMMRFYCAQNTCQCPMAGNIHFYSGLLLPLCRKASRGSTLQQLYEYSEKGFFEALFWFFQKCPALLTFYWHIISIPDRTAPCNKNATRL